MVRVKPGVQTRASHKKTLKLAKGYRMTRHKQIKKAIEATLHAGAYAYAGRKLKKRDMRAIWIIRLNAATRAAGMTYSKFISTLKTKNIKLDRKILSNIAAEYPLVFEKVMDAVK